MALGAMSVAPLKEYYLWQKEDWRSAARYLANNVAPGDAILADGKTLEGMGDAHWVEICLSYYLGSRDIAGPPILRVGERLWQDAQIVDEDQGEVWAVLWRLQRPDSWDTLLEITVVDFEDISVVRLREPSGAVLPDAASMLQVLLRLLPPHDHPDIQMALAETHSYMRELEEAARVDTTILELDPSK
jgi:hypothetical protein